MNTISVLDIKVVTESLLNNEYLIVDEVVTLPTGLIVFIMFHWVSDYIVV